MLPLPYANLKPTTFSYPEQQPSHFLKNLKSRRCPATEEKKRGDATPKRLRSTGIRYK